jgi:putative glutamine amidotransferase
MRRKPIIGIPADRRVLEPHPFHMAGEKYLTIDELVDQVDGVMLTGSPSDIEPHHYGSESDDPDALRDPHRDAMTLPIARHALQTGVPLFAICRGFQELNVVLGGTLHQKVRDVPGYHNHKENPQDPVEVQYGPAHPVVLSEGGMLSRLAGAREVMVNSLHGQGIRKLAAGVTVEAVADDGLIEAFTVDDAGAFALAVQWHPEWKVRSNEFSSAIFGAFGDACRERASRRRV